MICRINKHRFNDFMSSLSLREEDDAPMQVDGYEVHFITIQFDGASFAGANGRWEEFMNVAFRTNQVREKKKKDDKVEDLVEMGDSYNG